MNRHNQRVQRSRNKRPPEDFSIAHLVFIYLFFFLVFFLWFEKVFDVFLEPSAVVVVGVHLFLPVEDL
jgi:hypothetical protein